MSKEERYKKVKEGETLIAAWNKKHQIKYKNQRRSIVRG
jgi:hypothetical protein